MAEKSWKCSFADYFYLEDVKRCQFFELLWFNNDANRHSFVVHSLVTDYTSDKKKKTWLGLQENGDWLQSTQLYRRRLNTEKSPASLSVNFAGELASSNPQVCVCVCGCAELWVFPSQLRGLLDEGLGQNIASFICSLCIKKTFKTGHTFEITNI